MNEIIENTVVEIDPETGLPFTREGEATQPETEKVFVTEDATDHVA